MASRSPLRGWLVRLPGIVQRPAVRYWLLQVPGLAFLAVALVVAVDWEWLTAPTAVVIFILWFIKDLLIFPAFVRAFRVRYATGKDAFVGQRAIVVAAVTPERPGTVRIGGELWRGASADGRRHDPGEAVEVTSHEGLTLHVRRPRDHDGDLPGPTKL